MKKCFSDLPIIGILHEDKAGVYDHKHAISDATFYTLRKSMAV